MISTKEIVSEFCHKIGKDSLFVQGAGGNVSWKEDNLLWIKASGTWLSKAKTDEIFVPVDLNLITDNIKRDNFSVKPVSVNNSNLKPSIETLLHALMPQKFIVHLHAIEILSLLVRVDSKILVNEILGEHFNFVFLEYYKPGSELAEAMNLALQKNTSTDIVFLKNHGVVIGSEDMVRLEELLLRLTDLFQSSISDAYLDHVVEKKDPVVIDNYYFDSNSGFNILCTQPKLVNRLKNDWALYPDHVVFLGHEAKILGLNLALEQVGINKENKPPFIFYPDEGVYIREDVNDSQLAQLKCYLDVVIRQSPDHQLNSLKKKDVFDLLNWEDEKYRQKMV